MQEITTDRQLPGWGMNQDHPKYKAGQTATPAVLKWYDMRPGKEEWLYKIKQFYIQAVRNEAEVKVYVMLMGTIMQGFKMPAFY